ncbi:MAG: hypothetical protein NZ890_22620, partial [Myxococcota bacterium]|nr:hypothetical protein [Myxococcota bacterium]
MSAPATPENEKDKMDFRLPGPWDRCRFPGWGVRNVYLSPIALSVVLSMEDWPSALQVQQELMEALAHLLRLVGHVAAEHGFPLPVVAILDV